MLLKTKPYYGWPMLVGLSVAETLSWGILYYSFSVFIRPIEAELGWSRTQVTGAFSLALLVAGLAAVPVGHWLDTRGARGLMTTGSLLGALLFAALAHVTTLPALYVIWTGLGVSMAMVLYEPAFAVVATWFVRHRDRALTVLTLFGGLASTVVVPLATWLLERQGWRGAVLTLAFILACTTLPLHGLLLRRQPSDVGAHADGDPLPSQGSRPLPSARPGLGSVMAEGRFWGLTAAFSIASLATVATSVHVIPYLAGKGVSAAAAGSVLALIGLMQLPGRLLFASFRRRLGWEWTAAVVYLMQGAAVLLLLVGTSGPVLAAFVCLFGMGNGMATLLRASTLVELYGIERYGRVGGVVSFCSTVGRAAGPVLASVVYAAASGYAPVMGLLAVLLGVAAVLVLVPWSVPNATAEPDGWKEAS
jgi:MFS family permease